MTDARFIFDSSGEITQNPDFEMPMLSLAQNSWLGLEKERVETEKMLFSQARALRRAEFRMARGLLLEAGPESSEAGDDASLIELPTSVFEIVAADSEDQARMERIRVERQRKKEETEAERRRREDMEAGQRKQSAFRDARERLRGRRTGPGR